MCAMMCHMASPHGSPMVCPYLLAICRHHQPGKQTASHRQMTQPDNYFLAGIILVRIWMELNIIEMPNPLKFCNIASYLKGILVE